MNGSWRIGSLAGIGVHVHSTFLMLIGFFAVMGFVEGGSILAVLQLVGVILTLFGCVVLHELGHALMARRFGIPTLDITLLPIGGVARLERMPRDPIQEILVALAGPAVNVAIIAVLVLWLFVTGGVAELGGLRLMEMHESLILDLIGLNCVLILFNLLPAFPMDGGRVFRALLARRFPYTWATYTAARVGRWIALAIGLYGLFNNPFMILIAFFIWFAGGQEAAMVAHEVRMRGNSSGAGQSDIPRPRPERVRPVFQSTAYYSPGFNVDDLLRAQNRSRPQDASTGERQQEVEELFDRFFDDREK